MRRRAIILDDDPLLRGLLWGVFDQRGYEVLTFPDPGICPLHSVHQCPCPRGATCADVILSDIEMWEIDGIAFLEGLCQKGCRQPHFGLMSANWSEAAIARAERLQCTLFAKPFETAHVIRWLERIEPSIATDRNLLDWHRLGKVAE